MFDDITKSLQNNDVIDYEIEEIIDVVQYLIDLYVTYVKKYLTDIDEESFEKLIQGLLDNIGEGLKEEFRRR